MFSTFCVRHAYLPENVMKTFIFPVVKRKATDPLDKYSYRSISLISVIAKIFESMFNLRLKGNLRLHYNKIGFHSDLFMVSA